ncbi:MAG: AAA family ATPase, partial [ANME-2 cluster archaeon]
IYNDNLEHILDELRRIDRIVQYDIKKNRKIWQEVNNNFSGLYISEEEVNSILQTQPFVIYNEDLDFDPELDEIETFHREIKRKKVETINNGKKLRLQILEELFQLTSFDVDVLLICLAAELDLRYEKLYSYLQNDVTKKRPSVDLTIKLLCHSVIEGYKARDNFAVTAPLIKNHFIHLISDRQEDELPLLSKYIKVDERIINYLLESDEIDSKIRNFSSLIKPKKKFEDLVLPEELKNIFIEFAKLDNRNKATMFFFQEPYGTGKKTIAEAICNEFGTALLVVDSKVLLEDLSFKTLTFILRECLLQDSSLFLDGFDVMMMNEAHGVDFKNIFRILDTFPKWVFLSGKKLLEPTAVIKNHNICCITLNLPSYIDRKRIWESSLNGILDISKDVDIDALATKFKFSGGQIRDAIFTAYNIALVKNSGESLLSMETLHQGCKAQSNKKLTALARKIEPHHTWNDIVLQEDTKEQLKEVSGYIKYKGIVYTDWGFDKKLSLGKGLNVLFSGPSGTGKTMAAEIIGREVGLDIYKIDLSSVVSKYIGETEKNLQKIFEEAETSNAILFFDEADSLFGKRSEIRDSHDRYANIEINYLLQKMEEHEGIVILSTNFKKNVDDAFLRRMHFAIEISSPDEKSRKKIWSIIFPHDTPVGENVDFSFLSRFKITGGNIKNIALSAAFLAAGDSRTVDMEHIMRATKREFQKIGKLCIKEEFGKYYELIEGSKR